MAFTHAQPVHGESLEVLDSQGALCQFMSNSLDMARVFHRKRTICGQTMDHFRLSGPWNALSMSAFVTSSHGN
jgi:hypothetical protein